MRDREQHQRSKFQMTNSYKLQFVLALLISKKYIIHLPLYITLPRVSAAETSRIFEF